MLAQIAETSTNLIYSKELGKDIPFPSDEDALITETQAAAFQNVTKRAMQAWRFSGTGPQYIRISAKCIRYTKRYLKEHSESHLQSSTSDVRS